MRDILHNDVEYRRALSPTALDGNTALVSQVIDLANRQGCEFIIASNTLADADATFTTLVEHADNAAFNEGNESVPDAYLLGTEAGASFTFAEDDTVKKIGYIGMKRYVRLTITPANNTGTGIFAVIAALGGSRVLPHSSQG